MMIFSALLIATTTAIAPDAQTSGKQTLANPASVFCEAHDGKSVLETAPNGAQVGICVFPNGTRINEWAYFRSMHRTHK